MFFRKLLNQQVTRMLYPNVRYVDLSSTIELRTALITEVCHSSNELHKVCLRPRSSPSIVMNDPNPDPQGLILAKVRRPGN
jgi:hypothetical protein